MIVVVSSISAIVMFVGGEGGPRAEVAESLS